MYISIQKPVVSHCPNEQRGLSGCGDVLRLFEDPVFCLRRVEQEGMGSVYRVRDPDNIIAKIVFGDDPSQCYNSCRGERKKKRQTTRFAYQREGEFSQIETGP